MSTRMDEMRSLGCTVTFYMSFKTLTLKKWGSVYFYPERCKKLPSFTWGTKTEKKHTRNLVTHPTRAKQKKKSAVVE